MARLYGVNLTRDEIRKCTGSVGQIARVRPYELTDGKARRMRAVDVVTGSGFGFTVLPDRGMDVSHAWYRGLPLAYISPAGEVSPHLFDLTRGLWNFLRAFAGGLLTTCGLTTFGFPGKEKAGEVIEELPLHGLVHGIPADEVNVDRHWEGDEYVMTLSGRVNECTLMFENITLRRTITTSLGSKSLKIRDVVTNDFFGPSPHCILYHINLGYPVVSDGSRWCSRSVKITPRDEEAEKGVARYAVMEPPTCGFAEQVFFHEVTAGDDGYTTVGVVNEDFPDTDGLGVFVRYRAAELPHLVQWKMNSQGVYVCGVEPASSPLANREELRQAGNLIELAPGESRTYEVEIGVLAGPEDIAWLRGLTD